MATKVTLMTSTESMLNAMLGQLQAEISASSYRSIRKVAAALDEDYTTYYRWVKGKNPIRMDTVFATLSLIGVDADVFFNRVQERAGSARPTD